MFLLPFFVGLVRRDCVLEVIIGLFKVEKSNIVPDTEGQFLYLCDELKGCSAYSATLHLTMNFRSFVFLISSSSPSSGLGLRLTPPL